jgi:hypothetical protein
LLWNDREDTFKPAYCSMIFEEDDRCKARVAFLPGMQLHVDDLGLLRFPLED